MKHKLLALTKHSLVRYIFIGGTSYLAEVGLLYLLNSILQLSAGVAVSVSFWTIFFASFILYQRVAFSNEGRSKKETARQLVSYGLLVLFNFVFTLIFVLTTENLLGGVIISRTIALIMTTAWNYILYKKVIFKQ